VGTDAAPDDVLHARGHLWPVLLGRPSVAVPGQLEDAGRAADALHTQTGAEAPPSGAQVVDEGVDGLVEARRWAGVRRR
jgi:hypothetical protein